MGLVVHFSFTLYNGYSIYFTLCLLSISKLNSVLGNCTAPVPRPDIPLKQNVLHLRNVDRNAQYRYRHTA
jgi:hypothetical protein